MTNENSGSNSDGITNDHHSHKLDEKISEQNKEGQSKIISKISLKLSSQSEKNSPTQSAINSGDVLEQPSDQNVKKRGFEDADQNSTQTQARIANLESLNKQGVYDSHPEQDEAQNAAKGGESLDTEMIELNRTVLPRTPKKQVKSSLSQLNDGKGITRIPQQSIDNMAHPLLNNSNSEALASKFQQDGSKHKHDKIDHLVRSKMMEKFNQSLNDTFYSRADMPNPPSSDFYFSNTASPAKKTNTHRDYANTDINRAIQQMKIVNGSIKHSDDIIFGAPSPNNGSFRDNNITTPQNQNLNLSPPTAAHQITKTPRIPMKVTVKPASYYSGNPINLRNSISNFGKRDKKEGVIYKAASTLAPIESGENVIVIHAGSQLLRIGFASDPMPREIPHVIARRIIKPGKPSCVCDQFQNSATGDAGKVLEEASDTQLDEQSDIKSEEKKIAHGDDDVEINDSGPDPLKSARAGVELQRSESQSEPEHEELICKTIDMLYENLRKRQRETKRKPVPNALAQILSHNKSVAPEIIHDHNDPYKVEWIDAEMDRSSKNQGVYYGEKALNLVNSDNFIIRAPFQRGVFNVQDYSSVEDILGDIHELWSLAIEDTLGVKRHNLKNYYVVLAIPDLFIKSHVEHLVRVLLEYMNFGAAVVHQSSVLVTFGAGISNACVVDIGAQQTSIACVEDGYCLPDSRVNIKYGGDDITRFLADLLVRDLFPYKELNLNHTYDWNLISGLKEKHVTLNLSDVNIRIYDFFVRAPNQPTKKYMFKVYDEMYLAPWCLFYPKLVTAYSKLPDWKNSFISLTGGYLSEEQLSYGSEIISPTQFGKLPSIEETVVTYINAPISESTGNDSQLGNTIEAISSELQNQTSETEKVKSTTNLSITPLQTGTATPVSRTADSSITETPGSVKNEKTTTLDTSQPLVRALNQQAITTTNRVFDENAVNELMPLDKAIVHSIAHSGGIDKVRKFYSSIILVGGGISFIPDVDELLKERLSSCAKEFYSDNEVMEKIETFPSPRDLDPRVLVWKGGAVFSRLDITDELWISRHEWEQLGARLLRDRALFLW